MTQYYGKRISSFFSAKGVSCQTTIIQVKPAPCSCVQRTHMQKLKLWKPGAAGEMPGVAAVPTGADMESQEIRPLPPMWIVGTGSGAMKQPPRWALAKHRVRHMGEPVALVVAETENQARDAAEKVNITYKPLPAVTAAVDALKSEAPQLHEEAPQNRVFVFTRGDAEKTDRAIAEAPHVLEMEIPNNRLICGAIESRSCLVVHDPITDVTTLHDSTQAPHLIRRSISEALAISPGKIRVIAPDVGGGFGTKGKHYPEETALVWAARNLGRPIRWVAGRSESFCSDTQARDHHTHAVLGFDNDGTFLGLRIQTIANLGAYISTFGAAIPAPIYSALLAGVYRTPAIHVEVTGVFTNTVPVDAYRGAGRPEACFVLEQLTDEAARLLELDRVVIRQRNLIQAYQMPYSTPVGPVYDCGDFPRILDRLLTVCDWDGFEERRAKSLLRDKRRGIGLAIYVESSGVAPSKIAGMMGARVGFFESAEIRVDGEGGIQISAGTHNHGQGHETTYAQIVSDRLGLPFLEIRVVEGDTETVPMGTGTFGSRSIAVGGSAIARASDKIVAKGKVLAAGMMEAAVEDLQFENGIFTVAGTDRRVTMKEVAREANEAHRLPEGVEPGLHETAFYDPPNFAYSNGAHLCEIEIDIETGVMEILSYYTVDDIGTVINPVIVEGQIHGGIAQGVGQAMTELCSYDPDTGQLVSGSFLDYCLPRADDLLLFSGEFDQSQPCTHNPLGAKGCGESGSIGAPAALVSAALDALNSLGVTKLQMPLTPLRIWEAISSARNDAGDQPTAC